MFLNRNRSGNSRPLGHDVNLKNMHDIDPELFKYGVEKYGVGVDNTMDDSAMSLDDVISIRGSIRGSTRGNFSDETSRNSLKSQTPKPKWTLTHTHKKLFCIGVVVFVLIDIILLGVFVALRTKIAASSDASQSSFVAPIADNIFLGITDKGQTGGSSLIDTNPSEPDGSSATDTSQIQNNDSSATDISQSATIGPTATTDISQSGENDTTDSTENTPPYVITHTKIARFELLEDVPHDSSAFTHGLEVLSNEKIKIMKQQQQEAPIQLDSSYVVESTGNYGESTLRIVELATGEIVQKLELGKEFDAQGCTYYYVPGNTDAQGDPIGDNVLVRVVQIELKTGRGFVYELSIPATTSASTASAAEWPLSRVGEFDFSADTTSGEGWGIVYHPLLNQFIVSDGTKNLHFWELTETYSDPDDDDITALSNVNFEFKLVETIITKKRLSEAESWETTRIMKEMEWDPYSYGGSTILATHKNNEVMRIWVGSPEYDSDKKSRGQISHLYDLSVYENSQRGSGLNGIAFAYKSSVANKSSPPNEFWVTGKKWPNMYRVRLIDE